MAAAGRADLAMRAAGAAAASVLAALALAYYLTHEPAPRIGVVWRDGIAAERRAELERRFLLVHAAAADGRVRYDLLDTRRDNLEALVNEPDVADTESISRATYSLPPDYTYGERWMWVRHRLPVLRRRGVVEAIVAACVVVIALALRRSSRARGG